MVVCEWALMRGGSLMDTSDNGIPFKTNEFFVIFTKLNNKTLLVLFCVGKFRKFDEMAEKFRFLDVSYV